MIRDPRGGHNRKKVNEDFFKTWSPSMAYVLGFMFADGSLLDTDTSSCTYYLSFASNDLELLEQIKAGLASDHRVYVRPPRLMTHKNGKYTSRESYVFKFGNKIMYQDLLVLGLTHRKSKTMQLPLIPDEYFHFFLRGYFDGDGCINLYMAKGRSIHRLSLIFTSGSTAFLGGIADKIGSFLDVRPPRHYQSCGAYNLTSRGVTATKILDYIYSDLDLAPYLKRKYHKYLVYKKNLMGPRARKAMEANQALAISRAVSTRRLE